MISSFKSSLLLFFFCVTFMVYGKSEDLYKLLKIDRDATQRTIKKQYKSLSKRYHPDKNKGNKEAAEKFIEIKRAYEVLSNEKLRKRYDMYGEDGIKDENSGGGFRQGSPHDIFKAFFGFGGDNEDDSNENEEEKKSSPIRFDLKVDLKTIYIGSEIEVEVSKQRICNKCFGSGSKSSKHVKKCPVCNGQGIRIVKQQIMPGFVQQVQTTCDKCNGKGKIVTEKCPHCKGSKVERKNEMVWIEIEKGVKNGHQILLEGEGDHLPNHTPADIVCIIEHDIQYKGFERRDDDLYYDMSITLIEALTGFNKQITHIDERSITIKQPNKVTEHGEVIKIKNEGMPIHKTEPLKKGDLYIRIKVKFPKNKVNQNKIKELQAIIGE